jgi:hypothetical protein
MPIHEPPWDPHRVPGKPSDREDEDLNDFLATFDMVISAVRHEMLDEALSQNLERPHHLESALATFEDIKILDRAHEVVHEMYLGEPSEDDPAPVQGRDHPQDY